MNVACADSAFAANVSCERSDWELIDAFVTRSDNDAFAAIVQRHSALVYSAAMRQTRRSDLAQDVAQVVFLLLARKAHRFSHTVILSGWLLRATRFASANLMKTEHRRGHREQEAAAELHAAQRESAWTQLAPFLDEALSKLSGNDRDALALRFFEDKSLHEIGDMLGIQEEAAKKRVARAVERLRSWFKRRGLVISAAGLVAALVGNTVQAAPAGFARTIVTGCLKTTAPSVAIELLIKETTRTYLLHSTRALLKWLVPACVVGVGLISWWSMTVRPAMHVITTSPQETLRLQTIALRNGDEKTFVALLDLPSREERRLGQTLERVVRAQHQLRTALTNRFGAVDLSRFGFPLDEVNEGDLLGATVVTNGASAVLTWQRGTTLNFHYTGGAWRAAFYRPPNRTVRQLIADYERIVAALETTAVEVAHDDYASVLQARDAYRRHRR